MPTRNLTILFTDIQGFTARTSSSTRADVANLLEEHERLLSPVFGHFNGTIVKTIGDAFLVTFESPTDAVVCGLAIQDVLRKHNAQVPEGRKLAVRVAINVGEVEIRDGDVFGEPVNLAARLEGITEAGEVYFTEAVYLTMNRREAPSTSVGEHTFKGIPGSVRVYKVLQDASSEQVKQLADTIQVGDGQVRFVSPLSATGAVPAVGGLKQHRIGGRILLTGFILGGLGLSAWAVPIFSERMTAAKAQARIEKKDYAGALALLEAKLDKDPDQPTLSAMALEVANDQVATLEADEGPRAALDFVEKERKEHTYLAPLKSQVPRLDVTATLQEALAKGTPEYKFFDTLNDFLWNKYPKDPDAAYAAAESLKKRFIVEARLPRYRMALDRGHAKTDAMYEAAVQVLARNLPDTSDAKEGQQMLDKAFPDKKLAWAQDALVNGTGDALLNAWPVLETAKEPKLSQTPYPQYRTVMSATDVTAAADAIGAISDPKEARHAQLVLKDALARPMLPDAARPPLQKAMDALTARVGPLPEEQ